MPFGLFSRLQRPPTAEELLSNPEAFGGTPPILPQGPPPKLPPAISTVAGRSGVGSAAGVNASRTAASSPAGSPSPVDLILGRLGGFGRALQPVADFGSQLADRGRDAARSGALAGLAPQFTQGVMQADQNQLAQNQAELNRQLIEAQIGLTGARTSALENPVSQNPTGGNVQSTFTGDNGNVHLVSRDGTVTDTGFQESSNVQLVEQDDGSVVAVDRRTGLAIGTPISPEQASEAAGRQTDVVAGRAGATRQATEDVGAPVELEGSIDEAEQFIGRLRQASDDLKSGRLNTGFVAGRFPALSSAAQRFDEIASTGVLNDLASGSFGQLNTSELQFVKDLNIARTKNEDVNIDQIDRLTNILQREVNRSKGEIGRIQGGPTEVVDFNSLPQN